MQILSNCSTNISNCCSDYALVIYLNVIQKILRMVHIVVPIILIVMLVIQLIKLVISPGDSGGKLLKGILYEVLGAVVVFFLPMIISIFMHTFSNFEFSKCWTSADEINMSLKYTPSDEKTLANGVSAKLFSSDSLYDEKKDKSSKSKKKKKNSNKTNSGSTSQSGSNKKPTGTVAEKTRNEVVEYAKRYLGNPYVYGGNSLTNGIDCSGFVQKVYNHFGYSLPRTSSNQSTYSRLQKVTIAELKPGDLIFYGNGGRVSHVAIYIGKNQIIHASNKRDGIKISNANYRTPITARRVIR